MPAVTSHIENPRSPATDAATGDSAALTALLVGAIETAALSAGSTGSLADVPIRTDADRARVETAVVALVRAALRAPEKEKEGR